MVDEGDVGDSGDEPADSAAPESNETSTCAGVTQDGSPCARRVGEDEEYCYQHVDQAEETSQPTCAGVTQDGTPCQRRVGEDEEYCYQHVKQAEADSDDDGWETPYGQPLDEEDLVSGEAFEDDGDDDRTLGPGEGPEEDREMPLTAHIEEMLKRLAIVVAVAGIVSVVTFPVAEDVITFLWNSILPTGEETRPRLYGILELWFTQLKVASLAGLIVALPVLVHQTYQFMRPGLYPHERRYYLAAIPTSLVLALIGVSFAYFIVLPAIFVYFTTYTQGIAGIGFALGRTFDLILLLMGYLAVVFQIPLFIMLAMMMGLVTRRWLAARRLLFWGAFLGISFIFSPDPTGMAPIIVALTMVVLFEGTLLLTKWTGQGKGRVAG